MDKELTPDNCLENVHFYSNDLRSHLARTDLRQAIQAKRDWMFAGTLDEYHVMHQLHQLKHESCDDECKGFLVLGSLPWRPAFILLPRSRVSYEDLAEVFGGLPSSEAEMLDKEYVVVTSFDPVAVMDTIDRYLAVDPLVNQGAPMARADTATPAAVDTERALLGAILLDGTQLLTAVDVLPPTAGRWFHRDAHQLIWDACLTVFERHEPIDLETVADVLHRRGHLEKVGGSVALAELTEAAVTNANVAAHARIVKEKALLCSVINIGQELTASGFEQAELPAILDQDHAALLQVASAQAVSSFTPNDAVMSRAIHDAEHAGDRDLIGVPSGFPALDQLTSGFQPADLVILAARPSQGKSALATQLACAAARVPHSPPVVVFSLEMSTAQLGLRMLCAEARLDSQRLRRGFLSQPEWGQLLNAAERLRQLPIVFDDTPSLSVLDVRARTKRLQMDGGLALVVIDCLQLLAPSRRKDSRQQEVADISRDLKILAKELHVPVLALSQLSREVEKRSPPVPVLSDLRDSGAIEQDADLVLMLYRGDVYEPNGDMATRLIVAKQRNGPLGEVRLVFQSAYARFDPLVDSHHQAFLN
jgi:replicative DNA helicase